MASVALKPSSLTFCNSFFSTFFFYFSLLNYVSLLLVLSFKWSKAFIESFWCNEKYKKSKVKKRKKFQMTRQFFVLWLKSGKWQRLENDTTFRAYYP
jgi:hypothetical protein